VPTAVSGYGCGKWRAENLLRDSGIPWTIIKPGLVVGASARGLFGSIFSLVKRLPLVPVPSGAAMRVQPVLVGDVAEACIKVAREPKRHQGQTYSLALPSRSLYSFIKEVAIASGIRRVLVPVPWQIFSLALRAAEAFPWKLPVSRSSLFGLLHSQELDSRASSEALGMRLCEIAHLPGLNPLQEAIPTLETEARYLFSSLFWRRPSVRSPAAIYRGPQDSAFQRPRGGHRDHHRKAARCGSDRIRPPSPQEHTISKAPAPVLRRGAFPGTSRSLHQ